MEQWRDFWNKQVCPLFDERCLDYKVPTLSEKSVRYVNLDNAATTSPFVHVKQKIDSMLDAYGSVHRGAGHKSKFTTHEYDGTRDVIRKFVESSTDNYVIFAKNTTEAINHAATMWASIPGKILVSDIEHSSNLLPWLKNNAVIQYRTLRDGTVDLTEIEDILRLYASRPEPERVKLLTITGASTITGYKPPIHKLAALAHRYGAKMFADVCQLIQHDRVRMLPDDDPEHLDFVAFSGHKMYAPYGTGVLVGPKRLFDEFFPYQIGGGNLPYITRDLTIKRFYTERAHDPGTPNAMGAISIAQAIETLESLGREKISSYEHFLVDYTFTRLRNIPGVTLYITGEHLGHVIPFDMQGFDGRLVAEILAYEYGIGLRAGAFCTYEYIRKLKGVSEAEDDRIAASVDRGITRDIPTIIRASFALYNSIDDCNRFLRAITEISERGPDHYRGRYTQDETNGFWSLHAS
jgi:cysteine desulfurase / selenocysteine lyase